MSDLRNPNGFNSAPMASEEIREEIRVTDTGFGEQHTIIDNGGLSTFHHFEEEEEGSSKAKMIGGGLVVALLLGAAGFYAFTGSSPASMKAPASAIASNKPIQTAPAPAAMPAPDLASNMPDASGTTAKSPYDAAPAAKASASDTASVAPDGNADKPVKTARAGKTKDDAAVNQAESEQTAQLNKAADPAAPTVAANAPAEPVAAPSSDVAAATPAPDATGSTPLPTPPAPPVSSVASNGQSVGAQSAPQEVPAAPAVTTEQQAVTPAPQPE